MIERVKGIPAYGVVAGTRIGQDMRNELLFHDPVTFVQEKDPDTALWHQLRRRSHGPDDGIGVTYRCPDRVSQAGYQRPHDQSVMRALLICAKYVDYCANPHFCTKLHQAQLSGSTAKWIDDGALGQTETTATELQLPLVRWYSTTRSVLRARKAEHWMREAVSRAFTLRRYARHHTRPSVKAGFATLYWPLPKTLVSIPLSKAYCTRPMDRESGRVSWHET